VSTTEHQPIDQADAHADNQRRFLALEEAIAANTDLTLRLAGDTAELLDMWREASVVFRWLGKIGSGLLWVSKVVVAVGAVYGAIRYWGQKP
jgi:hypothetical protein